MRKLLAAVVAVGVIAIFGGGAATGGPGGTDRPIRCSGSGTLLFDPTTSIVTLHTEQICSHLGRGYAEGSGPFNAAGSTMLLHNYAANGDRLDNVNVSTTTSLTPTEIRLTTVNNWSGGTGRFSSATGSAPGSVVATIDPVNPLLYHFTFTLDGTVSY